MSRRERKLSKKLWKTKGILKSIRTKNKLFQSCYKCSEVSKIEFYKKDLNKLTDVKFLAKRQYYNSLLTENQSNPKKPKRYFDKSLKARTALAINYPLP